MELATANNAVGHGDLCGDSAMSYGHAERNLALIRQLEAETRQLLDNLCHRSACCPVTSRKERSVLP
jgi:hypothetical protein